MRPRTAVDVDEAHAGVLGVDALQEILEPSVVGEGRARARVEHGLDEVGASCRSTTTWSFAT